MRRSLESLPGAWIDAEASVRLEPRDIEDGVARKINQEVVVLFGWGRAILLQIAHPLVAAGVADHSAFRTRPDQRLRRLRRTVDAMCALTFGDAEEIARTAQTINKIHDRVHGQLREPAGVFPAGTAYSAHDPALLGWVHATLADSFLRTYELYVAPLTRQEKDRYCIEMAEILRPLGIPDAYLPRSAPALQYYIDKMLESGEITVTETARALAHELLASTFSLPWMMRLPTVGLLPPAIRHSYGFSWNWHHSCALRTSEAAMHRLLPLLPSCLRHWPASQSSTSR